MTSKRQGAALWDQYPWLGVLPPNRPDSENLAALRHVCQSRASGQRACVLGATPEYRRELGRWFSEVDVIDVSAEFKASVDWMAGPVGHETFIHLDWLEALPRLTGRYDLIVSHFTHGNIRFGDRPTLFRLIAQALTPQGIFFDTIFQPTEPLNQCADIVAKYAYAPVNLQTLNDLSCDLFFLGAYVGEMRQVLPQESMRRLCLEPESSELARVTQLAVAAARFVTPETGMWDYDPALPPEALGYGDFLRLLDRWPPEKPSVFQHSSYVAVSRSVG